MKTPRLLYVVVSAAIGGTAGAFLAREGALRFFQNSHSAFAPLLLIGAELLVFWAVISIHEAGHLLAATLVGFRGLLYVSGPLHFYRDDTGWRCRLNRNVALYGGLASALPLTLERLRERLVVMVAGGPVASLLSGTLALSLTGTTAPESFWRAILSSYALISIAIGIITLIPARAIGFLTDGGRLLRLMRGGAAVERDNAVLCLSAASYAGVRPRDWDRDVLAVVTRDADDLREKLTAWRYAFIHSLDAGDVGDARRHIAELLPHVALLPRPIHATVLISAAYFVARYDGDPVAASQHLQRARETWTLSSGATAIADAAIELASGRPECVEPFLAAADKVLAHAIDRGNQLAVRDMIVALRIDATAPSRASWKSASSTAAEDCP